MRRLCLSEEGRWKETWCYVLVLSNSQLKDLERQMTCFCITLYLEVVAFKITDVIAERPFWTLSISSVCACLPHKKINFSGQRRSLCAFVSLHLALRLAHTQPWWTLLNWGNCKCELEESWDTIWLWFCSGRIWRTKRPREAEWRPRVPRLVSEGQGIPLLASALFSLGHFSMNFLCLKFLSHKIGLDHSICVEVSLFLMVPLLDRCCR